MCIITPLIITKMKWNEKKMPHLTTRGRAEHCNVLSSSGRFVWEAAHWYYIKDEVLALMYQYI